MKKIVLTRLNQASTAVVFEQFVPDTEQKETGWDLQKEKAWNVGLFMDENPSLIGNIYIGHVRDMVRNIEAAFVEINEKELGYLSLKNQKPVFLTKKNTDQICEGDNLIVQVEKDRIKTKDAVLTTNFSLNSRLVVIHHGKSGVSFSSKIKDESFKKKIEEWLLVFVRKNLVDCPYSILVRTEAYQAEFSEITNELLQLDAEYREIIRIAKMRPKYHLLKQAEEPMVRFVKNNWKFGEECELVTDDSYFYEILKKEQFDTNGSGCCLRFYQDSLLPLYKLYSLESIFADLYAKKVWLKSGAYLVIEYTEAMTVIDVNTGKCEKGKNKEKTLLGINKEAAMEIARQLRIRNVSGIVIVDFIDMQEEASTKELLDYTRRIMASDPVKTKVVDITRLHLMEITRQKTTDRIPYKNDLFEMERK